MSVKSAESILPINSDKEYRMNKMFAWKMIAAVIFALLWCFLLPSHLVKLLAAQF